MINLFQLFVYSDQPVTYPLCGGRTEIILDLSHTKNQTQIHECINQECKHELFFINDHEFQINNFSL